MENYKKFACSLLDDIVVLSLLCQLRLTIQEVYRYECQTRRIIVTIIISSIWLFCFIWGIVSRLHWWFILSYSIIQPFLYIYIGSALERVNCQEMQIINKHDIQITITKEEDDEKERFTAGT